MTKLQNLDLRYPQHGSKSTRCPTGGKRQKSLKRVAIMQLVERNYAQLGRATLIVEIMKLVSISRARANEIVQTMAKDNELQLLSTGEKGQAQQILPRDALIPPLFFTGDLTHGRRFMADFPDEALIQKFCEVLIELRRRKNITNKQIEDTGRKYGIVEK